MKRVLLFLLVPALVAAFTLTSDTTYSKGPPDKVLPEYLALGDSLGVGIRASDPATTGYVPLFRDFLESKEGLKTQLTLNNLSISGATSSSLISDQLPAALAELQDRNSDKNKKNDVEVVTVDIGGNDVFALAFSPLCVPVPTPDCFELAEDILDTFGDNFEVTLENLREAAGPDTTIIVMTYYNPLLPPCPFAPFALLGDIVLEGGPGLPVGLNDLIRSEAAVHNAEVADTFGKLGAGDLFGDCLHANDAGYEKIAGEFIEAFND